MAVQDASNITQAIFGQDRTSGQSQIAIGEQDTSDKAFMIGYQHGTSPSGNYGYMQVSGDSIGSALVIANGGNVGIGTTSPSEKLEVSGNIKASGSMQAGGQTFVDTNGFFRPKSSTDNNAPSNSIYYSTTYSGLVYKDASNNVHVLY